MRPLDFPSVLIATGPFGDIKIYHGDEHFYISCTRRGLLLESEDVMPSPPTGVDAAKKEMIVDAVRAGITAILPGAAEILTRPDSFRPRVAGVFAYGQETLADPAASLHRRDRFGVRRLGSYLSRHRQIFDRALAGAPHRG